MSQAMTEIRDGLPTLSWTLTKPHFSCPFAKHTASTAREKKKCTFDQNSVLVQIFLYCSAQNSRISVAATLNHLEYNKAGHEVH